MDKENVWFVGMLRLQIRILFSGYSVICAMHTLQTHKEPGIALCRTLSTAINFISLGQPLLLPGPQPLHLLNDADLESALYELLISFSVYAILSECLLGGKRGEGSFLV